MITTTLKTDNIEKMFGQLGENFKGKLTKDLKEYVLEIDNALGYGTIRGISLKGGISYVAFDVCFNEDLNIKIDSPENGPLYFTYCTEGSIDHSFASEGTTRKLESFQIAIATSKDGELNILSFANEKQLRVSLITVQQNIAADPAEKNLIREQLIKTFIPNGTAENTMYTGSYNLKIAEKIEQLKAIKQNGIVKNLLIEGLVHMILALEIHQHTEDQKTASNKRGSLNNVEMGAIKEVTEYIQNFTETQLSVDMLCRKSGLSAAKLQEGFKLMHGRTVSDYIRDVRVKKSEHLIKTTDMNISEVVYSVGLTSRSYFSKIFKAKYNCSPKAYKSKQRISLSA